MNKETFIQKYLHDELTDDEYKEFVSLTESDPQFAEDVQIESILYAKHKQNLKSEILKNTDISDITGPSLGNTAWGFKLRNILPLLRNIAAIFILAVVSYYVFVDQTNESVETGSLVTSYLSQKHQPPSSLRNDTKTLTDPWTIAVASYKQEKFEVAAELIQKIDNRTNQQNLYLALSQLYSTNREMNLDEIIQGFNTILKSTNDLHKDEAIWFLSLAQILNNEPDRAKENLNEIISKKSWNAKQAAALLRELN